MLPKKKVKNFGSTSRKKLSTWMKNSERKYGIKKKISFFLNCGKKDTPGGQLPSLSLKPKIRYVREDMKKWNSSTKSGLDKLTPASSICTNRKKWLGLRFSLSWGQSSTFLGRKNYRKFEPDTNSIWVLQFVRTNGHIMKIVSLLSM